MEQSYVIGIAIAVIIIIIIIGAGVYMMSSSTSTTTKKPPPANNKSPSQPIAITALPSTTYKWKGNSLTPGMTLKQNEYLESTNGEYVLLMQTDGNLVIYYYATPSSTGVNIWNTKTKNVSGHTGPYYLGVQNTDNNIVLYSSNGALWNTNTIGPTFAASLLKLESSGNLVYYGTNGTTVLWSSGTTGMTT
ncbi:MAG: hypothetical protein ACYCPT_12955 [Acidimicrobiales bacterium]